MTSLHFRSFERCAVMVDAVIFRIIVETSFFKSSFLCTVQSSQIVYYYIPMKVIFIIGEIDCREGLLVAVERDRYASLAEGMERTIDIFLAALVKIIAVKKFNVSCSQWSMQLKLFQSREQKPAV